MTALKLRRWHISSFFWTSTSSQDPTLGSSWTKDDNTTGTPPGSGDDVYIQAVAGLVLANIWAAGGADLAAPTGLTFPDTNTVGGHLSDGTYYYEISAIDTTGESPLSSEIICAISGGTSTQEIILTWTASPGATGYKIYRSTSTGTELYLDSVGAVTTYTDSTANTPTGAPPGTVTFNSLTVSQTYTGTIGAPGIQGYWTQPATTWTIGTPASDGSSAAGSSQIKIDFGTAQFTGTNLASGSSTTPGILPIQIKGTNGSNAMSVLGGSVGVATNQPGEVSTVAVLDVVGNGSLCSCGPGVTLTTINASGGGAVVINSAATTITNSPGSSITTNGSGLIGTATIGGSLYCDSRPATCITLLNLLNSGIADFTGNPAATIVGTTNWYAGGVIRTDPANPGHVTFTTTNMINGGNRTLT